MASQPATPDVSSLIWRDANAAPAPPPVAPFNHEDAAWRKAKRAELMEGEGERKGGAA